MFLFFKVVPFLFSCCTPISFSSHSGVCFLCPQELSTLWHTGTPLPDHMPPQHGSFKYSDSQVGNIEEGDGANIRCRNLQPHRPASLCFAVLALAESLFVCSNVWLLQTVVTTQCCCQSQWHFLLQHFVRLQLMFAKHNLKAFSTVTIKVKNTV